jgi:hypothetical protein
MQKIIFVLLLFAPALTWAAKEKIDPTQFTVAIHVQPSRLADPCAPGCIWVQHLNVIIDGKEYELSDTIARTDLLRVGEYKARIFKDETERPYEYQRTYEFLMPDGGTRKYVVVAETE